MVSDQGRIGRLKKPTMEKTLWKAKLALAAASSSCMFVLMIVVTLTIDAREATKFSVELTDFKGLNATVGPTVSPVFSLKVHANNPRVLKPLCYSDGKVLVSYSNVALAWGHVPRFCVKRGAPAEFLLMPWGRGIGLSMDLHRHLATDWNMGTTQITVEMKMLYNEGAGLPSRKLHRRSSSTSNLFHVMLRGDEHL